MSFEQVDKVSKVDHAENATALSQEVQNITLSHNAPSSLDKPPASLPLATITDHHISFKDESETVAMNNRYPSAAPAEISGGATTRNGGSWQGSASGYANPYNGAYQGQAEGSYTSPNGKTFGGSAQIEGQQGYGGSVNVQTLNHGAYSKAYGPH